MIRAYRIVAKRHAEQAFSGRGAGIYGGRWNLPGPPVIYCASSLSLASLELFVHLSIEARDREFVWFEALVPKGVRVDKFSTLPDRWDVVPVRETSQRAGSRWLLSMHSAVLQVPSAITPGEFNFLLNPRHPEFGEIAISEPAPYVFDARIWK